MDTSTLESEELARFALGKRVGRNARIRRALIARLINEQAEPSDEEGEDGGSAEGGDEEAQLVRLLTGSRLLRRRRLRRLVLAHLLNERGGESDEYDEEETEEGEEGGTDDRELARLLIGSRMLRRRRVRRALLAHLIKQRSEADEDVDAGDGEGEGTDEIDEASTGERKFVRMVVGSKLLRRRRVRRALLAHLMKERAEAGEEFEGNEEEGDEETDLERQVARLLIGRRVVKRRRTRRALAAYLRDEGGFN